MKCHIVKIGGSVITEAGDEPMFNRQNTIMIAKELFPHYMNCILIHGTGSYGKPPAIKYGYYKSGIIEKTDRQLALSIKDQIRQLNQKIINTLLSENIPAMPVDIMHFYRISANSNKKNLLKEFLPELLNNDIVPIFFGDLIPQPNGNFKVLSSDEITFILSKIIKPASVIFLTNVDGVYIRKKRDGAVNGKFLAEVLDNSNSHLMWNEENDKLDVSGGMKKKAETAIKISKYSKRCCIGNGKRANILSGFLNGEKVKGTYIMNR